MLPEGGIVVRQLGKPSSLQLPEWPNVNHQLLLKIDPIPLPTEPRCLFLALSQLYQFLQHRLLIYPRRVLLQTVLCVPPNVIPLSTLLPKENKTFVLELQEILGGGGGRFYGVISISGNQSPQCGFFTESRQVLFVCLSLFLLFNLHARSVYFLY